MTIGGVAPPTREVWLRIKSYKYPYCRTRFPNEHHPNCNFLQQIAKAVEEDRKTKWWYRSYLALRKLLPKVT